MLEVRHFRWLLGAQSINTERAPFKSARRSLKFLNFFLFPTDYFREDESIEMYEAIKLEMRAKVEDFYTKFQRCHTRMKTKHVRELLLLTKTKST